MKIRLVIYNIHKCVGGIDRRYDLPRIVDVINHYHPDIVLLQEVVRYSRSSANIHQVDVLGEAIGLNHRLWVANVKARTGHGYGNAILSRWPLLDSHNIDLTIGPKKRRSALYARTRISLDDNAPGEARSRSLHLFNLHLGLSGIERRMQLKKMLGHPTFGRIAHDTPTLVAGDLNDIWGALGRQVMHPVGFFGTGRMPRTFPAYAPVRPLDSLYVRGALEIDSLLPSRLSLARQASDHLPLIADLRLV